MTSNFVISDHERKFREKISPTFAGSKFPIPEPTISPAERMKRRTTHRNEQYLHRAISCFSGKSLISIYPENFSGKICSRDEWFSDLWDGLDFARDFDFSQSFFRNFDQLQSHVPRANLIGSNNQNCDFATGIGDSKNCYLVNSSEYAEDCMYAKLLQRCKDIMDSSYIYDSELLYECFNVANCFDSKYLQNCKNCNDSWFCKNCIGCNNCFGCVNLKNKEYHFLNKKLSKEQYQQKIAELQLQKRSSLEGMRNNFIKFSKKFPHKYAEILNCENCTGDFMHDSKNCHDCYDLEKSEDCWMVWVGGGNKDVYDCSNIYVKAELCLETLGTINVFNCNFCLYVFNSNDLWYCEQCFSCKNCFGCVGLRNKEYCILNKQYSPEEYEKKVAEIIIHMQKNKEWGEFFPAQLSPFPYEETLANYYFPTSEFKHKGNSSISSSNSKTIPDEISKTDNTISREILTCLHCEKKYKIQPIELKFYRKMNVPIPVKCPDCRHWERMRLRNQRYLFDRKCEKCSTEVQSTFSPEQPEIIYCGKCYAEAFD
jgi:hypothetical protein